MIALLKKPIALLLAVNLLIGFFIFRDYGLTWDEPYFYSYADALGYAYTPANWFSETFDLNNSYGVSGDDHKTRGPAYLFLARSFVYGMTNLGSDSASAWHLVNFLFFQLAIYLIYRFARRWLTPASAFATTLLFSTQPLLWGHAFINPKDPPFLTFFLAAVCFGFEMVDGIMNQNNTWKQTLIAAFSLGCATSIRVLGPLAGMFVILYFIGVRIRSSDFNRSAVERLKSLLQPYDWKHLLAYGSSAVVVMFLTWPYLWENPISNFINVLVLMSDNPTNLAVLFNGTLHRAGELPFQYLPFMLTATLTEPVWVLFSVGLFAAWQGASAKSPTPAHKANRVALGLTLGWFLILIAYVFLRRPAMYDGFRHFLFILPPIFVFIGFGFEFIFKVIAQLTSKLLADSKALSLMFATRNISTSWLRAALTLLIIFPGVRGIVKLHPYEYAYYNLFVGGTDGAFRNYETDYWLTCYKEAVEQLNRQTGSTPATLFVKREAYIAAEYAANNIAVYDLGGDRQPQAGDYVLVNSRTNEDRTTAKSAPIVIEIQRGNATFCIVRQIP